VPDRWRDARFVVLELAPARVERAFALVWLPRGANVPGLPMLVTIPAGAAHVIVDTQRLRPWLRVGGWTDRFPAAASVGRFGLAFRDDATVRRLTLAAMLPPRDLVRLALADFTTVEPVLASTVNFHYGPSVLGVPLSTACGVLVLGLGVFAFVRRRPATLRTCCAGALALFVLFDLHTLLGLGRQVEASRRVSAWHAGREDEYRSRFGDAFARLDALVRAHVPRATPIALPDPPPAASPRRTNWLWFLYQGEYANLADRARDNTTLEAGARYVVFDRPPLWAYEPEHGWMRHRVTGATVAVAPVASVSDSVLVLRVVP
jgi:hypothetical protein